MLIINFEILGKEWKLKVLKNRRYKKKNGEDSVGMTKGWKRQIDLPILGVELETIIHELVHAYLTEMCHDGTAPTVADLEEIYSELMAKRGQELLNLAADLFDQILKHTKSNISLVKRVNND
jgi:hypothetical protein